jgi:hypothetical protein
MTDIEALHEARINAAEIALESHRDSLSRSVFMDDDPAMSLSQLLTSLQIYATQMGINFQAACDGDDENLWNEPDQVAVASPSM